MSPQRSGKAAYWCSGGTVLRRGGPIAATEADALLSFYIAEALALIVADDLAAARFCAGMALELASAIEAAGDWRRAARVRA
jgi:hypothetical protein